MKLIGLFMLLGLHTLAYARDMYPEGCTPWAVKTSEVALSNQQPVLIFMHNLSDTDISITHIYEHNPGVHAGFTSLLSPGKWSALTLIEPQKNFKIKCIESNPGYEQSVSCVDVLAVCQWQPLKLPDDSTGLFWAGENMNFSTLKAYIERRGFVLK